MQLGIKTEPLDSPLEAKAPNGLLLAWVDQRTAPITLLLSGNHQEVISFHVIDSPLTPLVLGFPWLKTHNPCIDWTTYQITSWGIYCHSNCLHSALDPVPSTPQPPPEPPDLSSVPENFHDLALVLCNHHAPSLLLHPPYDCAIDLWPRAPLPSSRLYNLSRPEQEAMERYIHASLAAGIIRPTSSPVGAGFFFVDKKDATLRPCIAFRGFNNITIKNKYPLPLISSAFAPLHGSVIFTKLDLRNAYHLV